MKIDKILGDFKTRYFGAGHKRTNYSQIDKLIKKDGDCIGYTALNQEDSWSNKKGVDLTPHLSTFDGIVLAVLFLEKYFEKAYPSVSLGSLFIDSFEIKAGATPIEDLEHIPVKLKEITQDKSKYWARIEILSMKIKLSLTHYPLKNDNLVKNAGNNYFSNHLKDLKHDLVNIDFLTEKYAYCDVVREVIFKNDYVGISSNYCFSISVLEWLIIFSQFAQVMVYNFDQMSRCDSDTLWMRTIKAQINEPFRYIEPTMIVGEIVKSSSLQVGKDKWRVLEMQGTTIEENVKFSGNVAHRLQD